MFWIKSVAVIGIAGGIIEKKVDMFVTLRDPVVSSSSFLPASPLGIVSYAALACSFLTDCLLTVLVGK